MDIRSAGGRRKRGPSDPHTLQMFTESVFNFQTVPKKWRHLVIQPTVCSTMQLCDVLLLTQVQICFVSESVEQHLAEALHEARDKLLITRPLQNWCQFTAPGWYEFPGCHRLKLANPSHPSFCTVTPATLASATVCSSTLIFLSTEVCLQNSVYQENIKITSFNKKFKRISGF